jgi:hypothetical protein
MGNRIFADKLRGASPSGDGEYVRIEVLDDLGNSTEITVTHMVAGEMLSALQSATAEAWLRRSAGKLAPSMAAKGVDASGRRPAGAGAPGR